MTPTDRCGLKFPDWMPVKARELFCELSNAESPYTENDFEKCGDATYIEKKNGTYKWLLDVARYGYHPSGIWSDGKLLGPAKQYSDSRNVLAVSYVRTATNGEGNRYFDNDAKFGNLYLIITPGTCVPWSPMIDVREEEGYRETVAEFGRLTSHDIDRRSAACADNVSDYKKKGDHIIMILPGQGKTHPPDELPEASKKQCEFVLQNTEMSYAPEKPIFDIDSISHPAFKDKSEFCVRIMNSQSWGDDPVLLQFPLDTRTMLEAGETVCFSHHPLNQRDVLMGTEIYKYPSLFTIGLTILQDVDLTSWGQ